MKQCPTDIWRDKYSKTDVSMNQITVLIWKGFIFYSQVWLPHQLKCSWIWWMYAWFHLIWLFALQSAVFTSIGEALIATITVHCDCRLSDSHQVWLMTCGNGAWPFFWLSSIPDLFFFLRCYHLVLPICTDKPEWVWFAHSLRFCSRVAVATQGW